MARSTDTRARTFAPGCRVCHGTGRVHEFDRHRMATTSRECECWSLVEQQPQAVNDRFAAIRDQRLASLRKDAP